MSLWLGQQPQNVSQAALDTKLNLSTVLQPHTLGHVAVDVLTVFV